MRAARARDKEEMGVCVHGVATVVFVVDVQHKLLYFSNLTSMFACPWDDVRVVVEQQKSRGERLPVGVAGHSIDGERIMSQRRKDDGKVEREMGDIARV
jgi:hypothetical protein